jgi:SpoVK/Ycf46/Vps4 family AAA+-type ATPase
MTSGGDENIRALREALKVSPDNVPLRVHLAQTLLLYGRGAEAEKEFREAIALAPASAAAKTGLARAYLQQGKGSQALVVLEEMVKHGGAVGPAPEVSLLYARALMGCGENERAAHHYRRAVEADGALADPALEEQLGVTAPRPGRSPIGEDESDDERMRVPTEEPRRPGAAFELERPKICFADVGGMESVKEEIRLKIIYPLTRPELYKAYGKAVGGGILMYGPPGCGKTHLARATAGEVKARFIAVGIADVLNMWVGESERNLHELFEQARQNTPCVLFFDEVDALGASRADLRHSGGRQLVNQFLSELDGVNASNEGLLILAATNAPWHIDPAFRRPGRFDRIVFVPPPDEAARAAITTIMLAGKPTDLVDAEAVARKTEGFSGADLKAMVDVAIEAKLREEISGRAGGGPEPLRTKDLLAAARQLKPTTREWFATARNHALYSNQGGSYDAVLDYLKLR